MEWMVAASTSRIPGCERSVAGRQSHRPHAVRGGHHRQSLAMLKAIAPCPKRAAVVPTPSRRGPPVTDRACAYPQGRGLFDDLDPPQTFALRADEILGNERRRCGDLGERCKRACNSISGADHAAGCAYPHRRCLFDDLDPPQTFALRADEILGNERQTVWRSGRALQARLQLDLRCG